MILGLFFYSKEELNMCRVELMEHQILMYNELVEKIEQFNKCAIIACCGIGKSYISAKYIDEYIGSRKKYWLLHLLMLYAISGAKILM